MNKVVKLLLIAVFAVGIVFAGYKLYHFAVKYVVGRVTQGVATGVAKGVTKGIGDSFKPKF